MRVVELLYPKQNPRRRGLHSPQSPRTNGDVIKIIKDLHKCGMLGVDILLHIEQQYGPDYLQVAKEAITMVEATHMVPYNKDDIQRLTELFNRPLSVEDAPRAICDIINDDALNDELLAAAPGTDALPIIFKWIEINMPFLLRRHEELMGDGQGIFSPLHGYDTDS